MAKLTPASVFKPTEFREYEFSELIGTIRFLVEMENFNEGYSTRKGFAKMDLVGSKAKIKGPEDLFYGAAHIENFSFVKKEGDYPGTLVILKDRLIFHTTCSYRLSGLTGTAKEAELAKMKADLVSKANSKGLFFEGSMEKFTLTRLGEFSKLETMRFMQDAKSALFGLELKAF